MKKRSNRDDLFEQVAAARTYINRAVTNPKHQSQLEMAAFLSIFHPDMSEETVRELIQEASK